jgi:hypothetical protein
MTCIKQEIKTLDNYSIECLMRNIVNKNNAIATSSKLYNSILITSDDVILEHLLPYGYNLINVLICNIDNEDNKKTLTKLFTMKELLTKHTLIFSNIIKNIRTRLQTITTDETQLYLSLMLSLINKFRCISYINRTCEFCNELYDRQINSALNRIEIRKLLGKLALIYKDKEMSIYKKQYEVQLKNTNVEFEQFKKAHVKQDYSIFNNEYLQKKIKKTAEEANNQQYRDINEYISKIQKCIEIIEVSQCTFNCMKSFGESYEKEDDTNDEKKRKRAD